MTNHLDHFSIDLETLDTRYSAAILSIGVVQFDPQTGALGREFYKEVDLASAIKSGSITSSRLEWWMRQSEAAREVFQNKPSKVSLAQALDELSTWLRSASMAPKVWSSGATFGISILEHAYDHGCVGLKEVWHFTNIRDCRTILDVSGLERSDYPPPNGAPHNALDDARWQAQLISRCWRKCRGMPPILKTQPKVQKPPVNDDEL
jgi:3' exoribonuclease, RNase T-like